MEIGLMLVSDAQHYERNARTHPQSQVDEIKASIRAFGYTYPMLVDVDDGSVIAAGHGRHIAVEQMYDAGETIRLPDGRAIPEGYIPFIDCSGWTEAQRRSYTLADNKIAENSGWDDALLKIEIGELLEMADDEAPVLGFTEKELREFGRAAGSDESAEDIIPDVPDKPVSRKGDIWILGDHRILCGDSTQPEDVEILLDGAKPHLMVTDPPYGVNYTPAWRNEAMPAKNDPARWKNGAGRATGTVLNDAIADWREAWALFPGEVAYVWHAGNKAGIVAESLEACGFDIRAQIIWAKSQFVIGRGHYHPHHEPCWYAVKGKGHWQGSRKESTLWQIDHRKSETGHGTQKPVECMRRPIANNSAEGDLVYEPFSRSGTTIIAGEIEARRVYAIELHAPYVDVAVKRWQEFSEGEAILCGDGRTFAEISAERLADGVE